MGWQDREYNAGREQMGQYFANPAGLLQWSVPIYKSPGVYIRLHFWFLLFALFRVIDIMRFNEPKIYIPIDIALMLAAVLWHELGHRVFARSVGGNHWEWVVWPLGGMIPPAAPRTARATFIANIGGIVFTFVLGGAVYTALRLIPDSAVLHIPSFSPFQPLMVGGMYGGKSAGLAILVHILSYFVTLSAAIVGINLFPAYWFDGGYIWQSILWPKFGVWKATMITCMAGMILAVPFLLLSLWGTSLLGLVVWALIFADCFARRRALLAAGPGVLDEDEVSYNYMDPGTPKRRKVKKRWFNNVRKKARAEQAEQAKIDAILAKVKEKGLHSLTWFEKRTLKKATDRQRKRDLANRF